MRSPLWEDDPVKDLSMDSNTFDEAVIDEAGTMSECPRCHGMHDGRFYGPCTACRDELRMTMGIEARDIKVAEYEPKMNVTPNAVAMKDD